MNDVLRRAKTVIHLFHHSFRKRRKVTVVAMRLGWRGPRRVGKTRERMTAKVSPMPGEDDGGLN